MKTTCGILVSMMIVFFTACASTPYNPSKPEMSVPEGSSYRAQPRTFNQFHHDWDY